MTRIFIKENTGSLTKLLLTITDTAESAPPPIPHIIEEFSRSFDELQRQRAINVRKAPMRDVVKRERIPGVKPFIRAETLSCGHVRIQMYQYSRRSGRLRGLKVKHRRCLLCLPSS